MIDNCNNKKIIFIKSSNFYLFCCWKVKLLSIWIH